MNILTLNYEYPPLGGGGGVVHALIAEELARRHRVSVITSAYADLPRREMRAGVDIHRVPVIGRRDLQTASLPSLLSYPPAAWGAAIRILRRQRFDIVNGHFAVPTGPGSLVAAWLTGAPHVVSLHGGDIYDPSKRLSPHRLPGVRQTVQFVLRRSAAVVAQSTNTQQNTYRFYRYRGPIEIIPLGIRQPVVPPASRAQLGLPGDAVLAVTVGRLVKRKRIEHLLAALSAPECAAVHLAVVGDGPERAGLEAECARLGVASRVHYLGHVTEERKWQVLSAADLYVSATMHEGFGLVYLEAMAAGLPVITYDEGGQVDFLRDGETGHLVPAGDDSALVATLARAVAHPESLARMGEANRRRAPTHRIERCAQAYEALFERVITRRAALAGNRTESLRGGPPTSRVLVVAPQPFFADRGTPIAVRHAVEGLIALGFEVDVLTYPLGRPLESVAARLIRSANPFGIRRVPIGLSLRKLVLDAALVVALRRLLRTRRYRVVHAVEEAAFAAVLLAPRYGARVVYDMHSRLPDELRRSHVVLRLPGVSQVLDRFEHWLFRHADAIFCSAGLASAIRAEASQTPVREWHFPTLPRPGSPDAAAAVRRSLGIGADARVVVYTGSAAPYQGLELLLAAVPAVRQRAPSTVFVLVGPLPTNGRLRAPDLERMGALHLVGEQPRERIPDYLAAADVLVSPRSGGANLPLKVFDYMGAGRPIVATDIPAHRTVLTEDRAVLVAPRADALAAGIVSVLEDPTRAARLAAGARSYAEGHLTSQVTDDLKALYADLLPMPVHEPTP